MKRISCFTVILLLAAVVHGESRISYSRMFKAGNKSAPIEVDGEQYFTAYVRPAKVGLKIEDVVFRLERDGKVLKTIKLRSRAITEKSVFQDYPWEVLFPLGDKYGGDTALVHDLERGSFKLKVISLEIVKKD